MIKFTIFFNSVAIEDPFIYLVTSVLFFIPNGYKTSIFYSRSECT